MLHQSRERFRIDLIELLVTSDACDACFVNIHGSTGDIYPVLRFARALAEAGHEVRFATVAFFRDEVERAGIEFVYLPPDWDQSGC